MNLRATVNPKDPPRRDQGLGLWDYTPQKRNPGHIGHAKLQFPQSREHNGSTPWKNVKTVVLLALGDSGIIKLNTLTLNSEP